MKLPECGWTCSITKFLPFFLRILQNWLSHCQEKQGNEIGRNFKLYLLTVFELAQLGIEAGLCQISDDVIYSRIVTFLPIFWSKFWRNWRLSHFPPQCNLMKLLILLWGVSFYLMISKLAQPKKNPKYVRFSYGD